jgi:hypothetical protein
MRMSKQGRCLTGSPVDDCYCCKSFLAVEAGVLHRGRCGEREKKNKFVLQARRGVQTRVVSFFLQIEKKNYRDGPYIALDLGSPMAPWLA